MNDQRKTKKQLLEDLERERQRSNALQEVSNRVTAAHDTDEILDLIVNEAERLVGATGAFIRLLAGGGLVASAATDGAAAFLARGATEMPAIQVEEGTSFVGHVMATKKPFISQDAQIDSLVTTYGRDGFKEHGFHGAAVVPLLADGRSIGVLTVMDSRVRRFTEDEVSLLSAFSDQASLALEKARLLNEAEREKERSDALYRVSNLLAGAHDIDEVLDLIVNEATRLVSGKAGFIRLIEGGVGVPAAATASAAAYLADQRKVNPAVIVEEGKNAAGHVLATMKPLTLDDAPTSDWTLPHIKLLEEKHGFHGMAIVPLAVNDHAIGLFAVFDGSVRRFNDDEVSLLMAFADQAALALEKARLLSDAETEKERSDALYRVSNLLAGAHATDDVLDLIVNEAGRLLASSSVHIRLLEGDTLVSSASTGHPDTSTPELISRFVKEGGAGGIVGHVMATKKPLFGEELTRMLLPEARKSLEEQGLDPAATAVVPLLANDQSIGTLRVADADNRGRRFTEDEVSLLSAFADQAALALEKARLLNEAETEKERSDALYRVSNLLAGVHDTDEVLNLIGNEAVRLLGASNAVIRLLEENAQVARVATEFSSTNLTNMTVTELGEGISLSGHVMATKKPLSGDEAAKLLVPEQLRRFKEQNRDPAAIATVPLIANDQSIGTLSVGDFSQGRRFTEDEVSLLTAFADQAALALEKARLLSDAETEKERSDALYKVSNLLAGAHDTDEVLDLIVNEAARLVGGKAGFIRLLEGGVGVPAAATASAAGYLAELKQIVPAITVQEGGDAAGHVLATMKPLAIDNLSASESVPLEVKQLAEKHGFQAIAIVPLVVNAQPIGLFAVFDGSVRHFTDDEISLLTAFADQASLALEKARLLSEAEARERQATQLYEVTTQLASNHDLDSVLELITQQAAELTGGRGAMILQYNEALGGLVAIEIYNLPTDYWDGFSRPGEGVAGRAFEERRAIWTDDIMADSTVVLSDDITGEVVRDSASELGVIGVVAAPIIIRDEVYGILDVVFDKGQEFTDEEINLIQNLADSAAVAINNARFIEETEQAKDEATQLYEITEQLASATDMNTVLDLITVKATELLGSHGSAMMRFDEASGMLLPASAHNIAPELFERLSARPGVGLTGRAFRERLPTWTRNVPADESLNPPEGDVARAVEEVGVGAVLAVPVIVRDEAYGALNVFYPGTHDFTDDEVRLLQTLADSAAVAIGNARFIEETQHARDDAEEANRTKSQFLANMSHELRTPLNAIIGYSEMLQEEAEEIENEEFEEDLGRINGAGKHLLGLINDVLDISKIEAGAMEIYLETFPVEPMVQDVVSTMQTLIEKNSNTLNIVCPDAVGSIHADTTKLKQCLFNLLSNASKFTDQGTISLTVSRDTEGGQEWINFAVGDTGIGMTDEQMGRLFEAFAQAEASIRRNYGGTGLGLAITRHFCQMMGGTVLVESEAGRGSTFTMKVPAVVKDPLGVSE